MRTSSFLAATFVSLSFAALTTQTGCGAKDDASSGSSDPEAVSSATDVTDVESNALSVASSIGGGTGDGSSGLSLASQSDLTGGGAGSLAPQALGDAAKSFYQPAGCLVVTDDTASSTATYVFSDCTGPHGLVHVSGTLTVGYSAPSSTELKLSFTIDSPFTITGAAGKVRTIDTWTATADITASGAGLADRTLAWNGHLTGETARGVAFDHSSTWQTSWTVGGDCLTENGTSSGSAGKLSVTTTVTDFQVCEGSCPAAGSEISITDTTDSATYDLKYGTGTATYTGPLGRSYTYAPLCAE